MSSESPSQPPVILASGSRIRAQLLESAGIAFETAQADIDETALIRAAEDRGEPPPVLAERLAVAKASARDREDAVVIGSDQLLVFEDRVFEKAQTIEEARRRLRAFSGRTHALVCGYAVRFRGETIAAGAETTQVVFHALSERAIDLYMARAGDALTQTVGGYEIEGLGLQLIERLEGDYFSALGLPMFPVLAALRRVGAIQT